MVLVWRPCDELWVKEEVQVRAPCDELWVEEEVQVRAGGPAVSVLRTFNLPRSFFRSEGG